MQADRYGPPTEQARHQVGWCSPLAARAARNIGKLNADHRCETCCHYRAYKGCCTVGTTMAIFSTAPASWCTQWSAALVQPEVSHA
jgi:hypothetical protein